MYIMGRISFTSLNQAWMSQHRILQTPNHQLHVINIFFNDCYINPMKNVENERNFIHAQK